MRNSGEFTVTAFEVNGYTLVSASPATVIVGATDVVHTFEYTSNAATVTIFAEMYVDTTRVAVPGFTPITVPATLNQAFSYNAPHPGLPSGDERGDNEDDWGGRRERE
jgi:hypothetical protein